MGYFPFFMELSQRRGLIVGGGTVALRKVEKLLPFGPALTVVAQELEPRLARLEGVTLLQEPFIPALLEDVEFVIAATDDAGLNGEISRRCRALGIPVNVVDCQEECSFLFPALVRCGPLTVGVCTGGASPTAAAWLRGEVEALLPERLEDILDYMAGLRGRVKETVAPADRAACLSALFAACLAAGGPPAEGEALLSQWEVKE